LAQGGPQFAWERALAAAFARRNGCLPGKGRSLITTAMLRRCHQMLWTNYDQRPWWQREVWDPALDPCIPRRTHEPQGDISLYFHQLQPLWLRHGVQWYLRVSLETGDMTWSTARARRSGLQVFGDWIRGQQPIPRPWLRDDPAGVRLFMLDFLSHVRTQVARAGPNRGNLLSPLRVNDIVTDFEKLGCQQKPCHQPHTADLAGHHDTPFRRGVDGNFSPGDFEGFANPAPALPTPTTRGPERRGVHRGAAREGRSAGSIARATVRVARAG